MVVALIPARSGSKRIKDKNIRSFCGKPLIAWTIEKAIKSECFARVLVSSDSEEYFDIAQQYGNILCARRPAELAQDDSPDQNWIDHAIGKYSKIEFAILRPTNPFRTVEFIRRAISLFDEHPEASEIRAVREVSEHPHKMWKSVGETIEPIFPTMDYKYPSHLLCPVFMQGAGIEIRRPYSQGPVIPIFANKIEGMDLDTEEQWLFCESLVKSGKVKLDG